MALDGRVPRCKVDPRELLALRKVAAMVHFKSLGVVCTAALLAASPAGYAALAASGTLTAQAGNSGNPAVQQTVNATANGTYSVGPLSGPQFGNNTTQGALIIGSQPSPYLSAAAAGSDTGVFAANGATTFIQSNFTFDFSVVGPQTGIAVTLLIGGSSDGLIANTGDPNRWNSTVGTRLEFASVGGIFNYAPLGPQSGTVPDVFAGNVQDLRVAWGQMASGPVAYTSYSSSFQFNVTVQSGQFASGAQVLKLATILQGGTRGVTTASGLASNGTANAFLNATLKLDPGWASAHPGYTLVMDPSIGVSPVPEPGAAGMMFVGLALLAGVRRSRLTFASLRP